MENNTVTAALVIIPLILILMFALFILKNEKTKTSSSKNKTLSEKQEYNNDSIATSDFNYSDDNKDLSLNLHDDLDHQPQTTTTENQDESKNSFEFIDQDSKSNENNALKELETAFQYDAIGNKTEAINTLKRMIENNNDKNSDQAFKIKLLLNHYQTSDKPLKTIHSIINSFDDTNKIVRKETTHINIANAKINNIDTPSIPLTDIPHSDDEDITHQQIDHIINVKQPSNLNIESFISDALAESKNQEKIKLDNELSQCIIEEILFNKPQNTNTKQLPEKNQKSIRICVSLIVEHNGIQKVETQSLVSNNTNNITPTNAHIIKAITKYVEGKYSKDSSFAITHLSILDEPIKFN